MRYSGVKYVALILVVGLIIGCGGGVKEWEPTQGRKNFFSPVRQLPPEPVYNRMRYTYLPEVAPEKDSTKLPVGETLFPTLHFEVKNSTLERAARSLAEAIRYDSYTAAVIANQSCSFNTFGTVDQIANEISQSANINVVVDHSNREIRFLANQAVEPRLIEGDNEHQPVN